MIRVGLNFYFSTLDGKMFIKKQIFGEKKTLDLMSVLRLFFYCVPVVVRKYS